MLKNMNIIMNKRNIFNLSAVAALVLFLVLTVAPVVVSADDQDYHGGGDDAYWEIHEGHDHDYDEWCPWDGDDDYNDYDYHNDDDHGYGYHDYDHYDHDDHDYGDDLDVSCRVSDTRVETDDRVKFTADVTGGNGPYDYDWYGDVQGNDRVEDISFHREGDVEVRIRVTDDDGNTATDSCRVVEVEDYDYYDDDLELTCRVSDTSVSEGDSVTYTAEIDGGESPYDYEWDGDISGDDRRETVTFNRSGRYEVDLTVEDDDGNDVSVTCPDVRVSDDNNYIAPASVSSVYLSQVPYTGPEDVFKVIGYILLILAASMLSVYAVARKKLAAGQSSRIELFKNKNKLANKIN
jgi:hypothetical protein